MIEVRKTEVFIQWLDGLSDIQARARVQARIERLATGVYFKKRGRELIILLGGGDKSTQAKDIKAALRFARDLSEKPQ